MELFALLVAAVAVVAVVVAVVALAPVLVPSLEAKDAMLVAKPTL